MFLKVDFEFLESSRHFGQNQWNKVCEWFGNDDFNMIIWGTFVVTTSVFWIIGMCFLLVDLTGKPDFVKKYRIQTTSSYPVTLNKVTSTIKQILVNQFLVGIPIALLFYHALVWRGYDSKRTLPSISRIFSEFLFFIFLEEILFYYIHRLFHVPLLFKHIHKVHHKWTSPVAITAFYSHPVEHVFNNVFPVLLGPFLLGSHVSTLWLWFSTVILLTMISHSGFQISQFPNPEMHDFHHLKSNCNYGVFGLLDRLHGTYVSSRRNKIF